MGIFSVSGSTVNEGTSSGDPFYLQWTISRSGDTSVSESVSYRLLSGTAQAGADVYSYGSGTAVTFAAGETSKTISFRVDADSDFEPDEAVVLEVYNPTGTGRLAGNASVLRSTGWVLDDDGGSGTPSLFVSRPILTEGDSGSREALFELSLSRPAPTAFTVSYSTVDGTAESGEDYTAQQGTVSFAAGQRIASVAVPVLGDTTIEDSEMFTLAISGTGALDEVSLGTALILDDDAGTPTVSVSGSSTREGTSSGDPYYLTWTITLDRAATNDVTVAYRLLSGTAQTGADVYSYGSGTSVTFAAGETSKTVSFRVDADAENEPDQSAVLEVYAVSGATLAGGSPVLRATGWVLDDDGGTQPSLFVSRPILTEGDDGSKTASFELSLSRPATQAFSVTYETVAGSARPGEDYTPVSGTLEFVRGQTTAGISVPVLGDTEVEPSEMFSLAISNPVTLEEVSIGSAFVLDDDSGSPTVSVTGSSTQEGTSSGDPYYLTWTITLDAAVQQDVTVEYRLMSGTAQAGSDVYSYGSGTSVTFAAGETSKSVSFRVDADSAAEYDEAVLLEVYSTSSGGFAGGVPTVRAPGWVLDDDGGGDIALYMTTTDVVEGEPEEPAKTVSFEISLSRPAPEAFTATYATVDGTARAGQDYVATSGEIAFSRGQTSASVSVEILGDEAVEGNESFSLAVGIPAGVSVHVAEQGSATITDDDQSLPPVARNISFTIYEDESRTVQAAAGVLSNDTDAEEDPLTARLISDVAHGTLVLLANGGFTYVPDADYRGTDSFTYVAHDGYETSSTAATVTLNVLRRPASEGDDVLEGTAGADAIALLGGNDSYFGLAGADTVQGGAGNDTISGGDGNDRLFGQGGNDSLIGSAGADLMHGGPGADTMAGGSGGDTYVVDNGGDVIVEARAGSGIDTVLALIGINLQGTNAENAELRGSGGRLIGSDVANRLTGRLDAADNISGGAGNDTIFTLSGNDTLDGGTGADLMNGGPGSDLYYVDNAADRVVESRKWAGTDSVSSSVDFRMGSAHIENLQLTGTALIGAGNGLQNEIRGNNEDNTLDGGKNNDTLVGGGGDDTYLVRAPGDLVIESAGGGTDVVKAYRAYELPRNVERLYLQTLRNDDGEGVAGINGIGNAADNLIVGNPYDNVIIGRAGSDTLRGQAGADTFVFDRAYGPNNVDRIIDFNMNEINEGDRLMMKGAVFGGLAAGVLDSAQFHLGTVAADSDDHFIFDQASGRLWFDLDGSGSAAQHLVATFEQNATLSAGDILIF